MKLKHLMVFFIAAAFLAGVASPVVASEKITVVLDWFINPDHGPLIIASEKGFFSRRGLDVSFQVPSNPNDPQNLLPRKRPILRFPINPSIIFMWIKDCHWFELRPSLQLL